MNELEVIFINKTRKVLVEQDKRYRVIVTLIRSDRPRYWNWLCVHCGSKVVELQNYDVIAVDDFYDPQNVRNAGVGKHCKGFLPDGLPCQYSYFFRLQ